MASLRSSAAYTIAVNYAAVFAWSILLLGGAVYWAVNAEFVRQRDGEIASELDRLSRLDSRAELLRELRLREDGGSANRFDYALFDPRGKVVAGNLKIALPESTGFADLAAAQDKDHVARRIGTIGTEDGSRLVVSLDSAAYQQVGTTILKYFLFAFAVFMLVGVASGWALARYLRGRLTPISATAKEIVAGNRYLRVPLSPRGDEFDTAGQALNLMLDRVEGLVENLRQVSSDIAHDLRKPLIRLLSQADRLGQVDGAEDRLLEIGDEMLALFSAILRIAEVEGGGLERSFEEFDLSGLMIDVSESFAPALADAGNPIEWDVEPNVLVLGNKELLAQLAANLLDNARIHTPAGTAITLALRARGARAHLVVEDNGPGVAPADREKLLQRFFRADASRTTPGNGLGLSLVASAAQAHGGKVLVEDAEPGLRVIVTLPCLGDEAQSSDPIPKKQGLFSIFGSDQ